MPAGSLFPDVCVPAWLGVVCAIVAAVALGLLLRAGWQRRRERREGRVRGWLRLSPGNWINLAAFVVTTTVAVASVVHCPDHQPVGISLTDSRLNPAGHDDPSDEYVCLVSNGDQPVSLAGWELRAAERRVNVLPNLTLQPGAAVRVHPGEGANSSRDLYGEKGSPQWRNEGGQISLFDNEGEEVGTVGYGERKESDGSGECGSVELALEITSPAHEAIVASATVRIRGTVTPGSVVQAKLDHDDESDAGGEVAQVVSGDGVDRFIVDLQLDPGENHIRVWAEKPGAEPAYTGIGVIRKTGPSSCDPNYKGACLDPEAEDYDCAGGEGNGPKYVEGPITVVGDDHFGLDSNGDGTACEP